MVYATDSIRPLIESAAWTIDSQGFIFNYLAIQCGVSMVPKKLNGKLFASGHPHLSCAVAIRTGLRSRRSDLQFLVWTDARNVAV
jgi:hypothetical protein